MESSAERSGLLTNIERPGTTLSPRSATLKEREALSLHLAALRTAGHAVIADEVFECGEPVGDIRVFHFKTCVRCKEDDHGK